MRKKICFSALLFFDCATYLYFVLLAFTIDVNQPTNFYMLEIDRMLKSQRNIMKLWGQDILYQNRHWFEWDTRCLRSNLWISIFLLVETFLWKNNLLHSQIVQCSIKIELIKDSWTELRGEIAGPPDTPYEGGKFLLEIKIPETYPFNPPKVGY